MLKIVFLFAIIASPSFALYFIGGKDKNETEHCNYLNKHRLDLSQCCRYPKIHYNSIFKGNCAEECVGSRDICCSVGCLWRSSNIIDDDNKIDGEDMKQLLKKSVLHDDHWDAPINDVVDECLEENKPNATSTFTYCNFPWHLIKVIGCTTRKLFMQCPKMKTVPECKLTKQYVNDCM